MDTWLIVAAEFEAGCIYQTKENIMYDGSSEKGMGECKPCKPDYKKVAAKQNTELMIIERFKESLIEFIGVIGQKSFKREASSIPELLGTVELDIIDRQRQHKRTLEMLEEDK